MNMKQYMQMCCDGPIKEVGMVFYIFCGTQKQNESQLEVGLTGDMRFTVDVGNNSQSQNSQFAYKLNNIHKVREYGVYEVSG